MGLHAYAIASCLISFAVAGTISKDASGESLEIIPKRRDDSGFESVLTPDEIDIVLNDLTTHSGNQLANGLQSISPITSAGPDERRASNFDTDVIIDLKQRESHTEATDENPDRNREEDLHVMETGNINGISTIPVIETRRPSGTHSCVEVCKKTKGCFPTRGGSLSYCKTWQTPQVCFGLYYTDSSFTSTCFHQSHIGTDNCPERWPVLCDGPVTNFESPVSKSDMRNSIDSISLLNANQAAAIDVSFDWMNGIPQYIAIDDLVPQTAQIDVVRVNDSNTSSFEVIVNRSLPGFATGTPLAVNPDRTNFLSTSMPKADLATVLMTTPTLNETGTVITSTSSPQTSDSLTQSLQPHLTHLSEEYSTITAVPNIESYESQNYELMLSESDKMQIQALRRGTSCQTLCDRLETCKGSFGSTCMSANKKQQPSCYGLFYTDDLLSRMCYAPKDVTCSRSYPVPCP